MFSVLLNADVTNQLQTVRIKVQSDQDLNNPALMDAILMMVSLMISSFLFRYVFSLNEGSFSHFSYIRGHVEMKP